MGKYKSIKFYAFNVRTNPPRSVSRVIAANQRQPGDRKDEIVMRIQALVKAARLMRELERISGESDVLKIMMAPEFYFRPATGAYTYDEFLFAQQQLYAAGFAHPEWSDWLIVAGTIVSAEPAKTRPGVIGFNTALIIQGGEKAFVTYEKNQFSNIDGMEAFISGWSAAMNDPFILNYMYANSNNYFSIDGIQFGLEICLDHGLGIMKSKNRLVDIHLITACGMNVKPENVMAPAVFRVDGQNYVDAAEFASCYVNNYGLKYQAFDLSQEIYYRGVNHQSGINLQTPLLLNSYEPIPVASFKNEVTAFGMV